MSLFVLVSAVGGEERAHAFVAAAKKMKKMVTDRGGGPFIAKVYRDGRVALWEDFEGAG